MDNIRLRFVPLGGVVGVTKNMYVYELYNGDELTDILIVDCGMGFPDATEFGVDLIIPDISYLEDKTDKIRAILFTHGHEDHIGALPFYYEKLGRPPIYASKLTKMFIQNKFKELGSPIHIQEIEYRKWYELGRFQARFIHVTHSIPDATHILIKTAVGTMYHGPDFKFDLTPPYNKSPDFHEITQAGEDGVLCLLSDALGAERPGMTASESIVGQTFEDEMRKTKGKFIMTTFSSNISRIRQCVDAAVKFNRKVVFLGRSMKQNTDAAAGLGYLPIPNILRGKEQEIAKLPPNKVCVIAAGSQGQYNSALSKMARQQNKYIKIGKEDKIVFSSDPIPGNEHEVYAVIEELSLQGADVVYPDIQDQLHASGHGSQEDLKLLARFTKPRFLLPIGGTLRHQRQYENLMNELGHKSEDIALISEGDTMWFTKSGMTKGNSVETKSIYVDAYGVGDIGNAVLRDRQTLSSDGIVVTVIMIDTNAKISMSPKFFSRGFVFEKNEDTMFDDAGHMLEKSLNKTQGVVVDTANYKKEAGNLLEQFFFEKRGRRPLVLVDVIQV
ncbi:ribonuclease J [Candidatus Roizmanbacteria bacterium CG_4_9_14_0_2_um_filter_39_13]|uniref:Ribonuclease J n=1 Tax=Candidatus Roizmanbacteria bacterium CG_4_9_14_0_2_um_filter_39_13 TaxID=1974839 RepID=A0A2M8F008_9BACT|nr:MAG: ribonuclease J [Candidatus Roizmanbacteria bacterium CG_4_10_14_0_2_um_filter_39_12]PJC32643.1 MAG: ribonuclease J [Candidatus Roizmanbacteria bacterium CG_4_9_14_0_2_um_filter_39_13]